MNWYPMHNHCNCQACTNEWGNILEPFVGNMSNKMSTMKNKMGKMNSNKMEKYYGGKPNTNCTNCYKKTQVNGLVEDKTVTQVNRLVEQFTEKLTPDKSGSNFESNDDADTLLIAQQCEDRQPDCTIEDNVNTSQCKAFREICPNYIDISEDVIWPDTGDKTVDNTDDTGDNTDNTGDNTGDNTDNTDNTGDTNNTDTNNGDTNNTTVGSYYDITDEDTLDLIRSHLEQMDSDLRTKLDEVGYTITDDDDIELISAKGKVVTGMMYTIIINVGDYENIELIYYASLPDDEGFQTLEIQEILTKPDIPDQITDNGDDENDLNYINTDRTATKKTRVTIKKKYKCKPFQTACASSKKIMFDFGWRIAAGLGGFLLLVLIWKFINYVYQLKKDKNEHIENLAQQDFITYR